MSTLKLAKLALILSALAGLAACGSSGTQGGAQSSANNQQSASGSSAPSLSFQFNGSSSITVPVNMSGTYSWSSSGVAYLLTSLTITNPAIPSENGADNCGNKNTANFTAFQGTNGTLGPLTLLSCQSGFTYTFVMAAMDANGAPVTSNGSPVTSTLVITVP